MMESPYHFLKETNLTKTLKGYEAYWKVAMDNQGYLINGIIDR